MPGFSIWLIINHLIYIYSAIVYCIPVTRQAQCLTLEMQISRICDAYAKIGHYLSENINDLNLL